MRLGVERLLGDVVGAGRGSARRVQPRRSGTRAHRRWRVGLRQGDRGGRRTRAGVSAGCAHRVASARDGARAAMPVRQRDGGVVRRRVRRCRGAFSRLDEPGELQDTLDLVTRLAAELTPSPLPDVPTVADAYGSPLVGWRTFVTEAPPADLDSWSVRHLTELAVLEATWVVAAGVDPDPIIAAHPVTRDVDPAAVDAFACALADYWAAACRKPGPPRSPCLRQHQIGVRPTRSRVAGVSDRRAIIAVKIALSSKNARSLNVCHNRGVGCGPENRGDGRVA